MERKEGERDELAGGRKKSQSHKMWKAREGRGSLVMTGWGPEKAKGTKVLCTYTYLKLEFDERHCAKNIKASIARSVETGLESCWKVKSLGLQHPESSIYLFSPILLSAVIVFVLNPTTRQTYTHITPFLSLPNSPPPPQKLCLSREPVVISLVRVSVSCYFPTRADWMAVLSSHHE